jgi:hypothetical protein
MRCCIFKAVLVRRIQCQSLTSVLCEISEILCSLEEQTMARTQKFGNPESSECGLNPNASNYSVPVSLHFREKQLRSLKAPTNVPKRQKTPLTRETLQWI